MASVGKVYRLAFTDLLRNKWMIGYAVFLTVLTSGVFLLGGNGDKALVSLLNVLLLLNPLIALIFPLMYIYQLRDYLELLLAQPLQRNSVFNGYYWAITSVLCAALLLGLFAPLLVFGGLNPISPYLVLILVSLFQAICFAGIGMYLALRFNNRLAGFGTALLVYLFFGTLYDGIFLLLLLQFQDFSLEAFTLVGVLLNPLDLGRLAVLFELDLSALLGHTGALFRKFFGSAYRPLYLLPPAFVWMFIPYRLFLKTGMNKDF